MIGLFTGSLAAYIIGFDKGRALGQHEGISYAIRKIDEYDWRDNDDVFKQ